MNTFNDLVSTATLLVGVLAVGCSLDSGPVPEDDTVAAEDAVSVAWLNANCLAEGTVQAKAVLRLANDASYDASAYQLTVGLEPQAALNIVDYREGDWKSSDADNQVFDTVAELDTIPFTTRAFFSKMLAHAVQLRWAPPCSSGGGGGNAKDAHYGHYITVESFVSDPDRAKMKATASLPGVAGIEKRYKWKDLEPTKGTYTLAEIGKDLDAVGSVGKQFVVFISDRSFDGSVIVPSYIPWVKTPKGTMAVRWDPFVVTRFKALFEAVGKAYDSHPALEGVAIQESSTGLSAADSAATGYSVAAYRDALIDTCIGGAQALPNSRFFWYMNFIAGDGTGDAKRAILDAVSQYGVVMGGPDILPEDAGLQHHAYPLYAEYKDKMALFCSAQNSSYGHLHVADADQYATKYWTMKEIFSWARTNLHIRYMFWNQKTWRAPADSYNFDDAKPVVAGNPSFNVGP